MHEAEFTQRKLAKALTSYHSLDVLMKDPDGDIIMCTFFHAPESVWTWCLSLACLYDVLQYFSDNNHALQFPHCIPYLLQMG